ncbi:hypothetical protein ACVWW6_000564 [Bradyrhizobium sp. USDA 3311]
MPHTMVTIGIDPGKNTAWTATISKVASATASMPSSPRAGYNVGLLLRWLAELLRAIIRAFAETVPAQKIA